MLFPPLNPPVPTVLDIIGNYLLLAAGIVVFLFALAYASFFDWRRTSSGKAIMYFVSGLVLLLGHTILTRAFGGDYLFRDLIRGFVYLYLLAVSSGLLINLVTIWKRGNRPTDPRSPAVLPPWRERVLTRKKDRIERRLRLLRDREREARP